MSSEINYKFRSMKNYSSIHIEGSGIPLWELKYEIITQRKMQSKDFDLLFYDNQTNEKIVDEYQIIERNSHIIVERIPLWMSSGGYNVKDKKKAPTKHTFKHRIAPPETYVCFRCGNKGHFIQHCPTNEDKSFDIARIRKPSGIPKDFLVQVKGEDVNENSGMLVTTEGYYVKAQPQVHEWKRNIKKACFTIPPSLQCPVCEKLFVQPVKTNCHHTFCERCVGIGENCKVCGKLIASLIEDIEVKYELDNFLDKK
ncbi:E3 ubiquitin-protein ligase RBBP6 [Nosema granulosis]|uniref:E3 ubiquitin-protein ligase RBBP6 n=1 Tax=Nosema granulosis TaxID=83296 RepID=A0A9P6GYZ2_9MICR|nr:E3 ubiquitin-protein ligase RBBP6 [Nosema granulosis]